MPRIPVRVEPYSSPSRQHRHYKNKRDQVLRALGKAAYINGSHFAIMWVSARGDVETYASEALQSRLDEWFVKGGIAEEAKQLVMSSGGQPAAEVFEDSEEEGDVGEAEDDVFLDGGEEQQLADDGEGSQKRKRPLAPLNTTIANQHFLRNRWSASTNASADDIFSTAPKSAPLFATTTFDDTASRTSTTPLLGGSRLSRASLTPALFASTSTPLHEITLSTAAARTAFLELRFGQLQQGVCKTVAKAWIKIIEPKKQTRCPYNKGEAGKPDWWPAGVRHKEPDHLMKPERHALLLTILRSPKVKVARLQLATAEVVALIKADKVSLLMDVYRIAREEEKLREGGAGDTVEEREVRVGVSTLDGWCREGSEPTTQGRQIARSVTPDAGDKRKRPTAPPAASTGMVKSNSTTTTGASSKRRATAIASHSAESRTKPLPPTRTKTRNSIATLRSEPLHNQLYGLGLLPSTTNMARSQSFSAAVPQHAAFDSSAESSPWPGSSGYFEANGLVTPLTATVDSAFASDLVHAAPGGGFYYPPQHGFYPPPAGAPHELAPAAPNTTGAAGAMQFEPNALGLDHWSFGQFDMPDLSSYNPTASGDASFSLDTSIDSVAPRTPSPGPPAENALRLDLPKHGAVMQQHQHGSQQNLHPSLMGSEQYWLPHSATGQMHPHQQ